MLRSASEDYAGQTLALTPDQRAVLKREAVAVMQALRTLVDYGDEEDPVPLDLAFNILYVSESRMADLGKLLGIELDSLKARQERYSALREANYKVANLERQLGQAASPATVRPAVATLCQKVRAWWRQEGFGHVSEVSVGEYGMAVKLSCYLMFRTMLDSDTPLTDKQSKEDWYKSLQERGFELVPSRNDDPMVAATTENLQLLEELIRKAFPSARLGTVSAQFANGGSDDYSRTGLRELDIFLPELAEVAALPDLPPHKAKA